MTVLSIPCFNELCYKETALYLLFVYIPFRERSGSVVKCLTRD